MNRIRSIRDRLGVTQAELAKALGKSQGNVTFYERGQMMPPEVARRLIAFANSRGVAIGYDDVYGPALEPGESGVDLTESGAHAATVGAEAEGVHHHDGGIQ